MLSLDGRVLDATGGRFLCSSVVSAWFQEVSICVPGGPRGKARAPEWWPESSGKRLEDDFRVRHFPVKSVVVSCGAVEQEAGEEKDQKDEDEEAEEKEGEEDVGEAQKQPRDFQDQIPGHPKEEGLLDY